jgi:hypothetical protein
MLLARTPAGWTNRLSVGTRGVLRRHEREYLMSLQILKPSLGSCRNG